MKLIILCDRALVLIIGPFLICQPLEYNWNPTVPGGHCGNTKVLWYITGVFNIVTDLVILLLPMPYLYGLDLAFYKKLALMCTFGIGLLWVSSLFKRSLHYTICMQDTELYLLTFHLLQRLYC